MTTNGNGGSPEGSAFDVFEGATGEPPEKTAAKSKAATATAAPATTTTTTVVTKKVAKAEPEAEEYGGTEADLSPLELFAGGAGGVEVVRSGPGLGKGWKSGKYRGKEVEYARAGNLPNSPDLFDVATRRWGGGSYTFHGQVRDRKSGHLVPFRHEMTFAGAPKPLSAEGSLDDDDEGGWELHPELGGVQWTGDGPADYSKLPPGMGMGMPGMGGSSGGIPVGKGFVSFQRDSYNGDEDPSEIAELRKKLTDMEHSSALKELDQKWAERFGRLEHLLVNKKDDGGGFMAQWLQAQTTQAAADIRIAEENRKGREAEGKHQLERENKEREDRWRREEADRKEGASQLDKRLTAEREQRDRMFEATQAAQREHMAALMKMTTANALAPKDLVALVNANNNRGGGMSDILHGVSSVLQISKGLQPEPSKIAETKEIMTAAGETLRDAIVPAISEAAQAWRGYPPAPSHQAPAEQPQVPQVQAAPAPQALPGPTAQPPVPQAAAPAAAPAPAAPRKPSAADWLVLTEAVVTRGYGDGKHDPEDVPPFLDSACLFMGVDFKEVAAELGKTTVDKMVKQFVVAEQTLPKEHPLFARIVTVRKRVEEPNVKAFLVKALEFFKPE